MWKGADARTQKSAAARRVTSPGPSCVSGVISWYGAELGSPDIQEFSKAAPVDEVTSPFLQGAYTGPCGAVHGVRQNVTKNAFLFDRLDGEDTANSTIFPTPNVSIVARWLAA
jgi:hypothetical protein